MYKFSQVNWGEDDATGDTGLRDYFVEIPEYKEIIAGNIRYVIGRKGTGKSAIAEKIKIDADDKYDWFYCDLSFKDFPLGSLRSLEDKSQLGKAKYIPIWTFLIYTKLISLILKDESCNNEYAGELRDFLNKNFPSSDIGFTEIIKNITEKKAKLSIPIGEGCLADTLESQTSVHYSKVNDILEKKIQKIHSNSLFFMLLDELDEGFSVQNIQFSLILLALFRAIEKIYKKLQRDTNIQFRPVVFLRSDIFDSLKDNDLNKLDDFILKLDWSKYSGTAYDLKSVVEARIKTSLKDSDATWEYIVDEYDENKPQYMTSLWNFMINRTYERPRDIIKFLKICRKKNVPGLLTAEYIKKAEFEYSNWLFKELDNEIFAHNSIWSKGAMLISMIGKNSFKREELEKLFLEEREISEYLKNNNLDPICLTEMLFNFGILGTFDTSTNRWIFKYKDSMLPFNKKAKLIVHYGLIKKFRLKITTIMD